MIQAVSKPKKMAVYSLLIGCAEPYDKAYSWLEATIWRANENGTQAKIGTWEIQNNQRGHLKYRKYEVVWKRGNKITWDGNAGCGHGAEFVNSLRAGDIISIDARAQVSDIINISERWHLFTQNGDLPDSNYPYDAISMDEGISFSAVLIMLRTYKFKFVCPVRA